MGKCLPLNVSYDLNFFEIVSWINLFWKIYWFLNKKCSFLVLMNHSVTVTSTSFLLIVLQLISVINILIVNGVRQ